MVFGRSFCAYCFAALVLLFFGCKNEEGDISPSKLQLASVNIGPYNLDLTNFSENNEAPVDQPIVVSFSTPLNKTSAVLSLKLQSVTSGENVPLTFSFLDNDKTISALPDQHLLSNTNYQLTVTSDLKGAGGEKFLGYDVLFITVAGELAITSLTIGGQEVLNTPLVTETPVEGLAIGVKFDTPLNPSFISDQFFKIYFNGSFIPVAVVSSQENTQVTITANQNLDDFTKYQFWISGDVKGDNEERTQAFLKDFYTGADAESDFPILSDDQLLTLVQQQTFKYFYDFAHPASGMARERNTSGNTVTSGGSGFGLMAIIVGIERNFITRQQGIEHLDKILDFLETADRFHGAWSHWIDGNTGNVQPFSANDNGGDLVETSFLVQGLITFRQYLNEADATELTLINRINTLWEGVEWDWYTKNENVLYWHWSPDKEWIMNHQIKGYNEALITYVLAASSPSHSINTSGYHQGWAKNGDIVNGKKFYDITLPLGEDYGGPLFFTHYSFLGLDPRNLNDTYANYWTQNVNHSLINHAYSVANPKGYAGYSDESWGLTASDNHQGYSAHSPTNDLGVITPTAALSSFPYTPEQSMKALKFFYYKFGDRLWGEYGFYDAYNPTEGWVAGSYLAIDQGPILVMIENHRTGLLWELFMSAPEVQNGLNKLSFTY